MSGLKGDLALMHREHDYWCECAEEVEKASTFSQQQTSTAFKQAHLLSMYIPLAHSEDSSGAGLSSQPLEECCRDSPVSRCVELVVLILDSLP